MNSEIQIPISEYQKIEAHGEETFPEECCGILIGNYNDGIASVVEARRMRNVNEGSKNTRYNIDPLDLVKLEDELDEVGLQILGIYHSHPNHPAKLSETDFKFAWPNLSYAVLSVCKGKADLMTSWRLEMNGSEKVKFYEEKIQLEEQ
ncbi:MAG: Mov34/MPN/PAD-1 family protein [Candidatus Kariarchaeaceae archaeon]|jgi:proteasome lid subunit RPN8/RPN11